MNSKSILKLGMLLSCLSLVGCGEENVPTTKETEGPKTWFTEKELEDIHLANLPTPTKCTGTGSAYTSWFNDGYTFSIPCESEAILTENATLYFNYFKENYEGKFGLDKLYGIGDTTSYYNIVYKEEISDYYGNNPCPLYKFFYATDTELASDGFLKDDSVYSFELRYDFDTDTSQHKLKLYMEKATKSHNGVYTLKYKLA